MSQQKINNRYFRVGFVLAVIIVILVVVAIIALYPRESPNSKKVHGLIAKEESDGIFLYWNPVEGVKYYVVLRGETPNTLDYDNYVQSVVTPTTKVVFKNLSNSEQYFRVYAVDVFGKQCLSNEIGITVTCIPKPPQNLMSEKKNSSITITWEKSNRAQYYVVYVNGSSFHTETSCSTTINSEPGKTYVVKIQARGGCGLSSFSKEITIIG